MQIRENAALARNGEGQSCDDGLLLLDEVCDCTSGRYQKPARAGNRGPDLNGAGRAKMVMSMSVRYRDQEWETASVVPVVMVWLILYVIAIVGSLTAPRPAALLPEVAAAVSEAPAMRAR